MLSLPPCSTETPGRRSVSAVVPAIRRSVLWMEGTSRAVLGSMPVWCSRAWCTAGSAGGHYRIWRRRRRRAEASAARPYPRRRAVEGSGMMAIQASRRPSGLIPVPTTVAPPLGERSLNECLQFINRQYSRSAMNHAVTVRANDPKVMLCVDLQLSLLRGLGDWH